MHEPDSARSVRAASLTIRPAVTEAIRAAASAGLSADRPATAARQAIAAWAMAVEGREEALAAAAGSEAVRFLLHPAGKRWQVAPGPVVTEIDVWRLDGQADPAQLRVSFRFGGRRLFDEAAPAGPAGAGGAADQTQFIGMLVLGLPAAGWHLVRGHVQTMDDYLGYVFTSRHETIEEYHRRTGSAPPGSAGQQRVFAITAGFTEHEARFGAKASVQVQRWAVPEREEAERLVWPAVGRETTRALGDGDWQPSLLWLEVIELRPDAGSGQ